MVHRNRGGGAGWCSLPKLMTAVFTLLLLVAAMPALAAVGTDFRQGSNDNSPSPLGSLYWINSILQQNNSRYYEGMVVPQRLILKDIATTSGNIHSIEFKVQSTKGGTHAYDFLTGWDDVDATSFGIGDFHTTMNECGPAIQGGYDTICSALRGVGGFSATVDLPDDPYQDTNDGYYQPRINAFESAYGNRVMKIYGNAAISNVQFVQPAASPGAIVYHDGNDTGDSHTYYRIQWESTASRVMIEFAGHLALTGDPLITPLAWGTDQGSSQINGGPYHFSLENLDTSVSLGAQDNQIKGADILVPPPTCSVTAPQTICAGQTASLTVTGSGGALPYTYRWEGPSGYTSTSQTISVGIAGTYTGYVIGADDQESPGCSTTVTVLPAPTADAGLDLKACETTGPIQLAATATNYSSLMWATSGTGSFSNTGIEDPTYTPSAADITGGSVTLTLTAYGNSPCGNASDTMTITFYQSPEVDAGANLNRCETTGAIPMAATASNYSSLLWTTSGTGTFSNSAIEDPTYTPSAADITAGTVTLTLTAQPNDGCAQASDTMTITFYQSPEVDAGANASVCETTGPVQLAATASNYASLLWTTSGTGTFSNAAIEDPTYTPSAADITAGTVTLTLTAQPNDGCAQASDTMTMTIYQSPEVDAGADLNRCETTGAVPMAATASNYASLLWTTSGTGTFSNAAIEDPTYTPSAADITAGSVTLTLTAQPNDGCASASDSLILTIFQSPEVNAGVDLNRCETTGAVPMAATASNYASLLWTTSGTGTFSNAAIEDPTYTPSAADITAGSVTLTLTAQPNDGCAQASDSMIITFFQSPEVNAGRDLDRCETTGAVPMSATASNYASLLWTTSGTGTFSNAAIEDPTYTPSAADITAGSVTLTLTAQPNDGCAPVDDSVIITFFQSPEVNAGVDLNRCETTGAVPMAATASNYASLLWTTSGTGTFSNAAIEDPTYTPSAADITAGSVTLTLTAQPNDGCAQASDSMIITFFQSPEVNAGRDLDRCETTGPVPMAATASNYASLLWTTSGTGTFSNAAIEDPTYTPSAADITAGSVTLTLTAQPNDGCAPADDSMLLTIWQSPDVNAGADADVCETTGPVQLDSTVSNYASLLWTTSGTGTFSNAAIADPTYTPSAADIAAGSVTLTLTAQPNDGCAEASDSMVLTIWQSPEVNANDDQTICAGDPVQLAGSASYADGTMWTTDGDGTFDDATLLNAVYTPGPNDIAAGTVTLTLTGNAFNDCEDATDTMVVTIQPCGDFCSLTQGAYGNSNGQFWYDGMLLRRTALIHELLALDPTFEVGIPGAGGYSIMIHSGAEQCVIDRLPAGGPAAALTADLMWGPGSCTTPAAMLKKKGGEMNNVFAGQMITLGLNLRLDPDLADADLCHYMTTLKAAAGPDGELGTDDDVMIPYTEQYFNVPEEIIEALGEDTTVEHLFEMANDVFGGGDVPMGTDLSDWNEAVSKVNEAFDECRFLSSCTEFMPLSTMVTLDPATAALPLCSNVAVEEVDSSDPAADSGRRRAVGADVIRLSVPVEVLQTLDSLGLPRNVMGLVKLESRIIDDHWTIAPVTPEMIEKTVSDVHAAVDRAGYRWSCNEQ